MGLNTYKVTGASVTALSKLLGVRLRVTGVENIVCRPTLFVANHFTRSETFLIPYAIFRHTQRQVRSLGTHSVFHGLFGRYFEALGGMSTRHPRRNRTIVRELMTWQHDWMIYPEGGLIKDKKTVKRGRYHLRHPEHHGPPHTGAAMLALKAEASKQRYLEACADNDLQRMEHYEQVFDLKGPEQIHREGIVITPVTLTFYPMRPTRNLVSRVARFLAHDIDPRLHEELTVEGALLLKGAEICIHFGEAIEVNDYLGGVVDLARRVAGIFSEERRTELFLRNQARRLTQASMDGIYGNIEVNFDHLFCYGLRVCEEQRIPIEDYRAALYVAAMDLRLAGGVRLHPTLLSGLAALVTGAPYKPWDDAVALADREGVARIDGDELVIDRAALEQGADFHTVRLKQMAQVLANEIEPVRPAVEAVRRHVNRSRERLRRQTWRALHEREVTVFERDYALVPGLEDVKPRDHGEPFLLRTRRPRAGVVVVHGYLAAPEQLRPLAEYLRDRGHVVYAVRLPGHGTAPEHLTAVTWKDWLEAVSRGVALVRQHCDQVVVGGFSLGGALALLAAAQRQADLAGVFAINVPVRLRDRRAPLIGPLVRWHGALQALGIVDGHYLLPNDKTEDPEINYGTDYLLGIRELRRAAEACRRRLRAITAPALIVQSDGDPLVSAAGAQQILGGLGSMDKVLSTLPVDRHIIVRGPGSEALFDTVARFVDRITTPPEPEQKGKPVSLEAHAAGGNGEAGGATNGEAAHEAGTAARSVEDRRDLEPL